MSYQSFALADSPIRYYRLNESSGTNVHDSGSQAQDGTVNGSITLGTTGLLLGTSDTAMTFSGGYIDVPSAGLPAGTDFTLLVWASITSFAEAGGSVSQRLFHYNIDGTNGCQVALDPAASNCFVFAVNDSNGQNITSHGGYSTGTLYLLAGVYVASSHAVTLYVNGSATPNDAGQSGYGTGTSGHCNIGRRTDGGGPLSGVLSQLEIVPSALSSDHLAAYYNAGITAPVATTLFRSHRSRGHILEVENVYR